MGIQSNLQGKHKQMWKLERNYFRINKGVCRLRSVLGEMIRGGKDESNCGGYIGDLWKRFTENLLCSKKLVDLWGSSI